MGRTQGTGFPAACRSPWLWLIALLAACGPLHAQSLQLSRLAAAAPAAEVVTGARDADFRAPASAAPVIFETRSQPTWWRVSADAAVSPEAQPQLVLAGPYLTRIEAWVPGQGAPSRHAIYGPDADPRYSARALVVPLPNGLPPGTAVYLRVHAPAAVPMAVSLQSRDQVHRADLGHVAWRSMILTALAVLAVLALAFWAGVGDRSFVFLALLLGFACLYLAAMGGEARSVPWLDALFGRSPKGARVIACLGIAASNLFMRQYLDLKRVAPWLDRTLLALTAAVAALGVVHAAVDARVLAMIGNLLLVASAATVLCSAVVAIWKGSRAARFLFASWLPLIVCSTLAALQLMGWITSLDWLMQAFAASFVLSGMLLTLGLSDKLLQLRRDRDRASHEASVDPLTAAHSRAAIGRALRERVVHAGGSGQRLCVAFIDIDRFKQINDGYGHHVGDSCLRYVAMRVRNRLQPQDLLGRFGGDELLALMPGTGLHEARERCEALREAVNCRPISTDDRLIDVSLSVGVAELRPGESAEALLARADAALYASKAAGRDRVTSDDAAFSQQQACL